ncbi:MAG TPA: universal stress protein, partial [Chloroflexia bacterium]|nr:universal stress protein [Chloroflexia bacterium]
MKDADSAVRRPDQVPPPRATGLAATRPCTVLVPLLNLSMAPEALSLAASLIAGPEPFLPQRARVVVLAVVTVPEGQPPADGRNMARAYRAMLGYLPATVTAAGTPPGEPALQVPVDTLIKVAPRPSQAIREAVNSEHADLLLVPWKGRPSDAEHYVFGRTLDELIAAPPCNVLLVRSSHWATAPRVLLPLRGGPAAELALDTGLQLAGRLGIGVTVVHGVPRARSAGSRQRDDDAPYLALQARMVGQVGTGRPVEQVITQAADVAAFVQQQAGPDD